MPADADDELRMLQRRAYGPDADIGADSAASARLRVLEGRAEDAAPVAVEEPDDEAPATPSDPEVGPEVLPSGSAASVGRVGRRQVLLLALALVAAAIVGFGLAQLVAPASVTLPPGARVVATLSPDPFAEVPPFFAPPTEGAEGVDPGLVMYEGLDDLVVVQVSNTGPPSSSAPDEDCLWVLSGTDAAQNGTIRDGIIFYDCSDGAFPATVQFVVTDSFPPLVRRDHPPGTALQFVLDVDAERVVVFADR